MLLIFDFFNWAPGSWISGIVGRHSPCTATNAAIYLMVRRYIAMRLHVGKRMLFRRKNRFAPRRSNLAERDRGLVVDAVAHLAGFEYAVLLDPFE